MRYQGPFSFQLLYLRLTCHRWIGTNLYRFFQKNECDIVNSCRVVIRFRVKTIRVIISDNNICRLHSRGDVITLEIDPRSRYPISPVIILDYTRMFSRFT